MDKVAFERFVNSGASTCREEGEEIEVGRRGVDELGVGTSV
jgi:hypothetical protein